jgi:carbon storage regulator
MLVLTRRAGQALRIGEGIQVQVVRIEGDRVVLGVTAPREVIVVRTELIAEVGDEVGRAASAHKDVLGLVRRRSEPTG